MAFSNKNRINRLLTYRHFIRRTGDQNCLYSHQIAASLQLGASLVRRDFQNLRLTGSTIEGYATASLLHHIDESLPIPRPIPTLLVANPQEAIPLRRYLSHYPDVVRIKAIADENLRLTLPMHGNQYETVSANLLRIQQIAVAILALSTDNAQAVAESLAFMGIHALVNLAPTVLHLPHSVIVENFDLDQAIEKVAFFALNSGRKP